MHLSVHGGEQDHHKICDPMQLLNYNKGQTAVPWHCLILQKDQCFSILKRYQVVSVSGQKITLKRYTFGLCHLWFIKVNTIKCCRQVTKKRASFPNPVISLQLFYSSEIFQTTLIYILMINPLFCWTSSKRTKVRWIFRFIHWKEDGFNTANVSLPI